MKLRFWPIAILWRWQDRHYRRRYGRWTHICDTRNYGVFGGWVLHLGPIKIRFG